MEKKDEIINKAIEILESCPDITLASIDDNGYPRPVAMMRLKADGLKTIWFTADYNSSKVKHYLKNPKAGVMFSDGDESGTLIGEVEILTDRPTRIAIWEDCLKPFFPQGIDDPNYCVLKFTAIEGTFWMDKGYAHTKL